MKKSDWKAGLKAIYPVCAGYIPLGLACGVLLQQAGYHWLFVLLMSVFIYGGASQFMIASLTVAGAGLIEMVIMVFFINLRHLLMSSSLAAKIKTKRLPFSMGFAQMITDESFAINTVQFRQPDWTPEKALASGVIAYGTWCVSTLAGALLGKGVTLSGTIMNFILIAMFIFLLISQIENRVVLGTAVFAGGLAVLLMALFHHSIAVVIASVIASCFGALLQSMTEKKGSVVHED